MKNHASPRRLCLPLIFPAIAWSGCDNPDASDQFDPSITNSVEHTQDENASASDDTQDTGSQESEPSHTEDIRPEDCAFTETIEPMVETPSGTSAHSACEWTETDEIPGWTSQEDLDDIFAEGTWSDTLTWDDGTQSEFRLTLSDVRDQRTLVAEDNIACDAEVLVDATVTLELPEEGLRWTQDTTLVGTYSLIIWSMGATVSMVLDEMGTCDNRLLFQGRQKNGPKDTQWIAEDKSTGAQGTIAIQD